MSARIPSGWVLASWIALAMSLAATGFAVKHAIVPEPLATRTPLSPNVTASSADSALPGDGAVASTLRNDPFRPGRRLPDDLRREVAARPDTMLPVSAVAIRLLGTVVRPNGSFALCQLPADVPRIVHVGDRLGELTLIALEQGRAVFQAPKGTRLELTLSTPRS